MSPASPAVPSGGFVPPPYPQDRLDDFRAIAAEVPGGAVDATIGTPVDPLPDVVMRALRDAAAKPSATGYPATIGIPGYRQAAADWIDRRFGVRVGAAQVMACIGTKEMVASLPRLLSLRDPSRDVVLYPAASYPTYEMGALLAGLRPVPVPVGDDWRIDLSRVADADAERALVVWLNDPSNPTGVTATPDEMAEHVEWARDRGIVVASDECYAEFTYDESGAPAAPVTALRAAVDGVLAVHSLSKRSNAAGLRMGFVAGDGDLVGYLGEMRKHGGMMTPAPVQEAAIVALGDDEHVDVQRERYARGRRVLADAMRDFGLVHDGGPSTFYLWLRNADAEESGWDIAARLARTGLVGAPGDLYGNVGGNRLRVALTLTDEQVARSAARLAAAPAST